MCDINGRQTEKRTRQGIVQIIGQADITKDLRRGERVHLVTLPGRCRLLNLEIWSGGCDEFSAEAPPIFSQIDLSRFGMRAAITPECRSLLIEPKRSLEEAWRLMGYRSPVSEIDFSLVANDDGRTGTVTARLMVA